MMMFLEETQWVLGKKWSVTAGRRRHFGTVAGRLQPEQGSTRRLVYHRVTCEGYLSWWVLLTATREWLVLVSCCYCVGVFCCVVLCCDAGCQKNNDSRIVDARSPSKSSQEASVFTTEIRTATWNKLKTHWLTVAGTTNGWKDRIARALQFEMGMSIQIVFRTGRANFVIFSEVSKMYVVANSYVGRFWYLL